MRGSPVMLGQVAVNLILNACEAQPRGGEVRVSSRREDGDAVAEIADRGPGVAEADRQRIFEPFFSTKDSTGLGLVDLPLDRPAARGRADGRRARGRRRRLPDDAPRPGGVLSMTEQREARGRVLVVEDEAYVRDSLVAILRARGFEVTAAGLGGGGDGASRAGRRWTWCSRTCGCRGPTAWSWCGGCRPRSPETPVIILTGHGTVASAVECLKAGASDYILKPADPEALEVALERALEARSLRREVRYLRERGRPGAGGAGGRERRPGAGSWPWWRRPRPPTPRSCCSASRARARSCWPGAPSL